MSFPIYIPGLIKTKSAGIPANPLAYYPFNGNADDESGNGFNGTVNGATLTTDRHANTNSAYSFDGIDDYISINETNEFSLDTFSISFWIKRSVVTGGHIISNQDSPTDGWVIYADSYIKPRFNNINLIADNTTPLSQWIHVVVLNNNKNVTFYIDNVLQISSGTYTSNMSENKAVLFGRRSDFSNNFLNADLDDVVIYDRVLTTEEIAQLYNQ